MRFKLMLLSGVLCLAFVEGCKQNEPVPQLARIEIAGADLALDLDVQATLQLTAVGYDGSNHPLALDEVTWSTSDPLIASVDQNGLLTGLGRGNIRVMASSRGLLGTADLSITKDITPDEIKQGVQSLLDARTGLSKIPGISVSILLEDGNQIDVVGGFSEAGVALDADRRFGLASITKTAVAAAILKLESAGVLSLSDPVSTWLTPAIPNIDGSITVYQLLNHLSGLQDYFNSPNIWPTVEGNLDQAILPDEVAGFVGPPVFVPGARYEYSNTNYLVLGIIIERATGKKLSEVLRENFWGPLALESFHFGAEESPTGPLAAPFRDSNGDGSLENIADQYRAAYHSVFYAAADIFSTAHELAIWARELYSENGQALSPGEREKMLTFYPLVGFPDSDGYGLGVRRYKLDGRELWGHGGGMRGYTTFMFWDPSRKMSFVILTNQSLALNSGPRLRELISAILTLTAG